MVELVLGGAEDLDHQIRSVFLGPLELRRTVANLVLAGLRARAAQELLAAQIAVDRHHQDAVQQRPLLITHAAVDPAGGVSTSVASVASVPSVAMGLAVPILTLGHLQMEVDRDARLQ